MAKTETPDSIEIEVDVDPDYDAVVLTLRIDNRTLVLGFNLQEAQLLSSMLNEATTGLILEKLGLPSSPETRH